MRTFAASASWKPASVRFRTQRQISRKSGTATLPLLFDWHALKPTPDMAISGSPGAMEQRHRVHAAQHGLPQFMRRLVAPRWRLAQRALELLDLHVGLFFCDAIALLQPADQIVTMACTLVYVIVRELAPFLLELTAQLRPLAFDDVLVHFVAPS